MSHSPKGTRSDLDFEIDRLAQAMADVMRLPPDPRGRVGAAPGLATLERTPAPASSVAVEDGGAAAAEDSWVAPGVDRRELRKLKRGDYIPGTRLDLHAQTAAQAVANVKQFIDSRRNRYKCVCIVHGRGLHSKGNVSVLKTKVRQALRRHAHVLAYADAPRTDGGNGAVYVLLRK